jgi:GT2 family glycosyltransferase
MPASLPSVTIVTPVLNAATTIQQTIDSVTRQAYGGELEHVIIDGGSTDGTLDIVDNAGLRCVSEPEEGLTHALNKGIGLANNEIFAQLNADDYYLPGALTAVGQALAANPSREWLTGRCLIVDENGKQIRVAVTRYKNLLLKHWSFSLHLTQNFVSAPATFVRTDALREVGGFDERFSYSMDYDLWLKLGRRGPPIVLDRQLAAFRMAGASLSLTGFERQFLEHAINAIENGDGHPVSVMANRVMSRAITIAYRLLRARRRT